MRKYYFPLSLIAALLFTLSACNNPQPVPADANPTAGNAADTTFVPAELPATLAHYADWHFPEDSARINTWTRAQDLKAMYRHGWGLWDALTASSGQSYKGSPLLLFETWHTPEDVREMLLKQLPAPVHHARHNFQALHQLAPIPGVEPAAVQPVVGFVKWNPATVNHVVQHKLLYASILDSLRRQLNGREAGAVPAFPNNAVALKPVYQVLNKAQAPEVAPGIFRVPAWPGSPHAPQAFGNNAWGYFIYVDTNNKKSGGKNIITKKQAYAPEATYGLGDFIWFQADAQVARDFSAAGDSVQAGDYLILLGMHIAARETQRWTWQTMFWAHDPGDPAPPGKEAIALERPVKFQTPAAGHYTMALGYSMILPDQPYSGGSGAEASPLYVFNPWLEAGFDKNNLRLPASVGGKQQAYGVQSNCMSCHAYASYPGTFTTKTGKQRFYTADRYVDMRLDSVFTRLRNLQTDFLWSVQGNVIVDK